MRPRGLDLDPRSRRELAALALLLAPRSALPPLGSVLISDAIFGEEHFDAVRAPLASCVFVACNTCKRLFSPLSTFPGLYCARCRSSAQPNARGCRPCKPCTCGVSTPDPSVPTRRITLRGLAAKLLKRPRRAA